MPAPPSERLKGRNSEAEWRQLFNRDVVSMPDKWEYPWVGSDTTRQMSIFLATEPTPWFCPVIFYYSVELVVNKLIFSQRICLKSFFWLFVGKRPKEGCDTTQEEYCLSFLIFELFSWPTHLMFSFLFFPCSMRLGIWLSTCFPWAKLTLILPKTSCCCFFVSGTWPPMVSYQPMSSPWGMSTRLSTRLRVWWFIKWQVEKDLGMMNFYHAASRNFSLISLGKWLFSFSSWWTKIENNYMHVELSFKASYFTSHFST